jgi:hypothetical protein
MNEANVLNKKQHLSIIYGILSFMLYFQMPLISVLNGTRVVLLFVVFLFISGISRKLIMNINNPGWALYFFSANLMVFITILLPLVYKSFDYSLFSKYVSSVLVFIVSYIFFKSSEKYTDVCHCMLVCYIVQSFIILLSIANQGIYDFLAPFRLEVSEGRIAAYGRLRGNAVSGFQFFGISTMYGFVIIFQFLHSNLIKHNSLFLILLSVVGIISGRYTVVAIGIGMFFLFLKFISKHQIKKVIYISILICTVVFICGFLLLNYAKNIKDPTMNMVVKNFLVKPIESIVYDHHFHSDSTDTLKNMYESDYIKQFFTWGSGRFMNEDGSYFGHVDAGYYRILGYYGIIGTILLFLSIFILLFLVPTKLDLLTRLAYLVYFFALNIKGDITLYQNNILPILVAVLFFYEPDKSIEVSGKKFSLNFKLIPLKYFRYIPRKEGLNE